MPRPLQIDLSPFLDLGKMYATDRRQTDVRRASSLNAPAMWAGHNDIT